MPLEVSPKRVSQKLGEFLTHLSMLLSREISLEDALELLAVQQGPQLGPVLLQMRREVQEGDLFSRALARNCVCLPPWIPAILRAGEGTGEPAAALQVCSELLMRKRTLLRKLRGLVFYPFLILLLVIALALWFQWDIVPLFAGESMLVPMGESPGGENMQMRLYWFWGILLFLLIPALAGAAAGLRGDKKSMDFLLGIPGVGKILHLAEMEKVSYCASFLLKRHIPLERAFAAARQCTRSEVIQKELLTFGEVLKEGGDGSFAAGSSRYLKELGSWLSIAEETGNPGSAVEGYYRYCSKRLQEQAEQVLQFAEPLLILYAAALVVLFAFLLVLPYLQIYTDLFQWG